VPGRSREVAGTRVGEKVPESQSIKSGVGAFRKEEDFQIRRDGMETNQRKVDEKSNVLPEGIEEGEALVTIES